MTHVNETRERAPHLRDTTMQVGEWFWHVHTEKAYFVAAFNLAGTDIGAEEQFALVSPRGKYFGGAYRTLQELHDNFRDQFVAIRRVEINYPDPR